MICVTFRDGANIREKLRPSPYHPFMASPALTGAMNQEMVTVRVLLRGAMAIHKDLLSRLDRCPNDRSLRKQIDQNEILICRLVWGYRTAIAGYISRLSKSQLVF